MLVDSDVHVGYETLLDLLDYLDPPTRELVTHSGTNGLGMPTYPWCWDFDEPGQTLRRFPSEWRDPVAHANAMEFFRLPAPVSA